MKMRLHHLCLAVIMLTATGCSSLPQAGPPPAVSEQQRLIGHARTVLDQVGAEKRFPLLDSLLPQSCAVLVYPEITQIGVGFGGAKGKGVLFLNEPGKALKPLALYSFEAASGGVQLGVAKQSLILVMMRESALQYVLHHTILLNLKLLMTAGPGTLRVGSSKPDAAVGIYYFSKRTGPFAGVYLENGSIRLFQLLPGAPSENGPSRDRTQSTGSSPAPPKMDKTQLNG